jgi:hypothetical protein
VQAVVNERLVRRESKIGGALLAVTFSLLLIGFFFSLQQERWSGELAAWAPVVFTYAVVIIGMAFYYLGNARLRRFGPRYRLDGRLREQLKGLDDRYVLYSFLGKKLPDYILVGPTGVFVLTTRIQDGEITCQDDRWSRQTGFGRRLFTALYGNPIGSPSYDSVRAVSRVKAFLENVPDDRVTEVPVTGLIVFTSSRVRLHVQRCSVPATTGKELKRVVSRVKARLSSQQLAWLQDQFKAAMKP